MDIHDRVEIGLKICISLFLSSLAHGGQIVFISYNYSNLSVIGYCLSALFYVVGVIWVLAVNRGEDPLMRLVCFCLAFFVLAFFNATLFYLLHEGIRDNDLVMSGKIGGVMAYSALTLFFYYVCVSIMQFRVEKKQEQEVT